VCGRLEKRPQCWRERTVRRLRALAVDANTESLRTELRRRVAAAKEIANAGHLLARQRSKLRPSPPSQHVPLWVAYLLLSEEPLAAYTLVKSARLIGRVVFILSKNVTDVPRSSASSISSLGGSARMSILLPLHRTSISRLFQGWLNDEGKKGAIRQFPVGIVRFFWGTTRSAPSRPAFVAQVKLTGPKRQ